MLHRVFGAAFRGFTARLSCGISIHVAARAARLLADGNALIQSGNYQGAISVLERALHENPHDPEIHNDLGCALALLPDFISAAPCFREALRLRPDFFRAHLNLAMLYIESWQLEAAAKHLEQGRIIFPGRPEVLRALGVLSSRLGDAENAVRYHREAAQLDLSALPWGDYLLSLSYCEDSTPEGILAEHRACAARASERQGEEAWSNRVVLHARQGSEPFRVGYISPDFREHSVRYFFEPLISHHDRGKFRIFCYSDNSVNDAYTESCRLRADGWRDIRGTPDRAVAERIAEDRIHILVELAGHTDGNRLSLLNRRVAPIQITALGYPPSTGLSTIDYKLSDPVADPPGAERYYSERLLRLPDCFWCFSPPACGEPAPPPFLRNGFVTFACFGSLAKITPTMLKAWAEILERVPDSRLRLKGGNLGQPYADRLTRERLARAGIDLSRVILEGPSSPQQFPFAYQEADIILDTFPCNGGTTTCFALWMGVPVVSMAGTILLSRMGISMLHQLGLNELVAKSFEEYVSIAERLARSPEHLRELRQFLRPRMAASPLSDAVRYTRHFEIALENIWRDQFGTKTGTS